jgi:hypothetical protein
MDAEPYTPEEVDALDKHARTLLGMDAPESVRAGAQRTLRWVATVRAAWAARDAYRAEATAWMDLATVYNPDTGAERRANCDRLRAANEAREQQA